MAWAFLAASLVGVLFTLTALVRLRQPARLTLPWFLAGWLTGELALHHMAWQALATVAFAAAGALEAWPGWWALGLTLSSWLGLGVAHAVAGRSAAVGPSALGAALGGDYLQAVPAPRRALLDDAPPAAEWARPFHFRREGVQRIDDVEYGPALQGDTGGRNRLDVYRPARANLERAPVLFQIHGGAWISGDKRQQAVPLMTYLAQRGWVCFAINYRLSPHVRFPAHIVDVKRALTWVRDHAREYGGDPGFIAVTGGSAGGHLAALTGLSANDPAYQPGFEAADTSVQACVPFYGVFDLQDRARLRPGAPMLPFLIERVFPAPPAAEPELWEAASPLQRVHADAPPFLIVQGTHDSLVWVEEARHFERALREKSRQPVVYAEYPGAQHAFDGFHSLRADHAVRTVARFLEWGHARTRPPDLG